MFKSKNNNNIIETDNEKIKLTIFNKKTKMTQYYEIFYSDIKNLILKLKIQGSSSSDDSEFYHIINNHWHLITKEQEIFLEEKDFDKKQFDNLKAKLEENNIKIITNTAKTIKTPATLVGKWFLNICIGFIIGASIYGAIALQIKDAWTYIGLILMIAMFIFMIIKINKKD